MHNLNELSSRIIAAVSSVTLSIALFAYAIIPAEQGITLSGAIA